ncbi:hypothetical protein HJC23_007657 [Cyclotella cryptica]|uniref:Uncharacterized protein n=1 Tax=Cyclotella cryptica TaxID=29204 RepID=A0ABD3NSR0_9STRA|eukprot:CCRYP_020264-RA/>CCRYP_020264-RA protein AED:0.00 eAED:0.00 QI:391/1/1/1/0/0/2/103/739
MSGGNNEIPVQLDLEGGFVVGQPPQPSTHTRRDSDGDHDEYFNARHFGGELQDYDIYDDECDDDDFCDEDLPEGYYYESPSNHDALEESQQQQSMESSPSKQDLTTLGSAKQTSKPQPTQRPIKTILGPPPTLLRTTTQVISSNLEKYHPHAFSIFSECQWESIIECRCESFTEVAASLHHQASSKKLLMPPLSEKHLSLIENHPANFHFRNSVKVDYLLWRKIVDYTFPIGGMMRPAVLEEPWEVLVGRLVEWGKDLVELFELKDEEDAVEEGKNSCQCYSGDVIVKREDVEDSEEDAPKSAEKDEPVVTQESEKDRLKAQSAVRTSTLHYLLKSIQYSPMDVKILSDTGVGKCVSKVIKIAYKLMKSLHHPENIDDDEMEDAFAGYPYFWRKSCRLCCNGASRSYTTLKIIPSCEVDIPRLSNDGKDSIELSPLELLEQLLREWKEMASESGVAISSTSASKAATEAKSPTKKQRVDSSKALKSSPAPKENETSFPFASFGKPRNSSMEQHITNMNLLHSSPNWRSLYHTLQKREKMVRIAQGEKVRASRESLEKNRPKIGKVVLKKAVGRVRGLGPSLGSAKGQERREAILNKSLGKRAQAMQANGGSGSYNDSSTKSSGKLSQLRQESKVAAKWSKGTQKTVSKIAHNPGATFSSFGASVARAGGSNTTTAAASKPKMVGNQARVKLQGGKQMTLPSAASAKSIGMFSSLQKDRMGKKSAAERVAMKRESGKRKR